MNENVLRKVTHSHAALHTGLVCVPTAIAVDPHAEVPELPRVALEEWLHMPAERQAPPSAVATIEDHHDRVVILIADAHLLTPTMVVQGPLELVGRFAAAFMDPTHVDGRAILRQKQGHVIEIKAPGGTGPGPGPKLPPPPQLARTTALAELARMPTIEIANGHGTPGGPRDHR